MRRFTHRFFILAALMGSAVVLEQELSAQSQAKSASHSPAVFRVQFVQQFRSSQDLSPREGLGKRILNLLVGQKHLTLTKPVNLLSDSHGRWWILDQGSGTILIVDPQKHRIRPAASPREGDFPSLVGICMTPTGEVLVTDSKRNHIYRYQNPSQKPRRFNDSLQLHQPTGIAYCEKTDQIWVAETAAHRLAVLDSRGRLLKYVGRRGTEPGSFNFPTFLWCDREGFIYVVDALNFRIQIFTAGGDFLSAFGEPGDATGYFARPKGVATDSFGHIYVVDGLFHTVQVFDREGNFLYRFGQQGREEGEFWLPTGIFVDRDNRIYVADSYNARIQVFQLVRGTGDEN